MRAKILWTSLILVLLLTAGYTIYTSPNTQYFECTRGAYGFEIYEEDGVKDKFHASTPVTIKVKKYLLGYYYTIDDYTKENCGLREDYLSCYKDESDITLNLATGKIDTSEKYVLNKKNIEASKFNWECKSIERVVK